MDDLRDTIARYYIKKLQERWGAYSDLYSRYVKWNKRTGEVSSLDFKALRLAEGLTSLSTLSRDFNRSELKAEIRLETEKLEAERQVELEKEARRLEKERKVESERLEKERRVTEERRIEAERFEKERLEAEKLEKAKADGPRELILKPFPQNKRFYWNKETGYVAKLTGEDDAIIVKRVVDGIIRKLSSADKKDLDRWEWSYSKD